MNGKIFRSCPICLSSRIKLVFPATTIPVYSYQVQVTEKYFGLHGDLVRCKSCGFTFIGREPFAKKIVGLYKNMSDAVYLQEENERRRSFISVLKEIKSLKKGKKGNILDIGCCTGGLLVEAKKRGWEVVGVDPSQWAVKMANKLHNLKVYNGIIESYKAPKNSFDAITMLDVLEHVINPRTLLLKVNDLLKPSGILCIVTPDYGSLTARLLGKRWWGVRLAHLSYFRKEDLYNIIQEAGFQI